MTTQTAGPTLPGFDPFDPEFLADPFPTWARAQDECPVFFYPEMNFWVLTKYDDILRAVTDWQTFSSRAVVVVPPPPEMADTAPRDFFKDSLVAIDPPKHTVSRKAEQTGFTRPRIAAMESLITEIADRLIDDFIADGHCDLMRQFCYPLSLRTIVGMLGIDDSDEKLELYRQCTEDMFMLLTPKAKDSGDEETASRPLPDEVRRGCWERLTIAGGYYQSVIDERRANPGEDLISAMIEAVDAEGEPAMEDTEIVTHIQEVIAAGNDTTANLMGSLLLYISQQPDDFAELKSHPELMEGAVEEGLRRRGSAIGMFRLTTRDVTVSGIDIPAESLVFLAFQAAGHDPEHFPDPRRVDVRRPNAGDHLAFGKGRHFCMGAPLARLEARIGLQRLLERIPELEIVPDQPLEFAPTMTVSMLHSLEARWAS